MKIFTKVTLTLAGLSMLAAAPVMAEDAPSADMTTAFYSQYIWRGFELSQDSLVIQPSLTVGYKGFSMNMWGNLDTEYYANDTNEFNETDLTLGYDGSVGKLGYSLGYIYYALDGLDSQEVYAGVSLDTLLSPSLTIYKDMDTFPSWYFLLGVSHGIALGGDVSLDLGASVSYLLSEDEADYAERNGDKYKNFHDGMLSAAVSLPVGKYMSVTPEVNYVFPLSSEASDIMEDSSVDGDDDSFIYGGVSVSFAF